MYKKLKSVRRRRSLNNWPRCYASRFLLSDKWPLPSCVSYFNRAKERHCRGKTQQQDPYASCAQRSATKDACSYDNDRMVCCTEPEFRSLISNEGDSLRHIDLSPHASSSTIIIRQIPRAPGRRFTGRCLQPNIIKKGSSCFSSSNRSTVVGTGCVAATSS